MCARNPRSSLTPDGHARQLAHDVRPSDDPGRCLLYTSDAADERSSVDLGGRRIIKKKKKHTMTVADKSKTKDEGMQQCTERDK